MAGGQLRWLASILLVANVGLLIWMWFDRGEPEIYFPFLARGESCLDHFLHKPADSDHPRKPELEGVGKDPSITQPNAGPYQSRKTFPRTGDVYESLKDQTVSYLIGWRGPFTTGGEGTLLKGERVWINSDATDEKPIGTYALPVERERLEERMVTREDRDDPKYGGFYFFVKTVDLSENFKLVETGYTGVDADEHH